MEKKKNLSGQNLETVEIDHAEILDKSPLGTPEMKEI